MKKNRFKIVNGCFEKEKESLFSISEIGESMAFLEDVV